MASKRLKKKHAKQAQVKTLKQAGYTNKEIKRMQSSTRQKEVKRIERNVKVKTDRQNRRNQLLQNNIPLSIITHQRIDSKKVETWDKSTFSEYRRMGEKLDKLKAAGYKVTKIPKTHLKYGWEKLRDKYPKITLPENAKKRIEKKRERETLSDNQTITAKEYLYVGFAEEVDGFYHGDLSHLSADWLSELIHDYYNEIKDTPDGSKSFRGVFIVKMGTKSEMDEYANTFYSRGYSFTPKHIKFDAKTYSKITVSNQWSRYDFLSLVYSCITQTSNEYAVNLLVDFKRYCVRNNLPFLADIDFVPDKHIAKFKKKRQPKKKRK